MNRMMVVFTAWAIGAFIVSMVVLSPAALRAAGKANGVAPENTRPTLTVNGCDVFVRLAGEGPVKAGVSPNLELVVSNPTDHDTDVQCQVSLASSGEVNPMSRMGPIPQTLWTHDCRRTVPAGETLSLPLRPEATLAASATATVMLSAGEQRIMALSLPVEGGQAAGASRLDLSQAALAQARKTR